MTHRECGWLQTLQAVKVCALSLPAATPMLLHIHKDMQNHIQIVRSPVKGKAVDAMLSQTDVMEFLTALLQD